MESIVEEQISMQAKVFILISLDCCLFIQRTEK